ncbi:MAG: CdaR family protein [Anaerolineae bacterium]|nr:CdaR family protein [Anaerolineae bacterium]
MRRPLLIDLSSALIALILALTIWVVAMREQNPMVQDHFPQGIPIEVVNKGEDLLILGDFEEEVTLLIRAPQKVWGDLGAEEFHAYIDLADLGVGTHEAPVKVQHPGAVRVVEKSPDVVSITLDKAARRQFGVRVNILGEVPVGYKYGVSVVTPSQVVVSGPQSLVDQVEAVVIDLQLRGEKATIEKAFEPWPQNRIGGTVSGVEISPPQVMVQLPIEQESGYRDVSVKVVTQGTVASGYWISDIRVNPSTVTVYGDPQRVSQLLGFVETELVDVEGAKTNLTRSVGLVLPEDISLLGVGRVLVRISVSPVLGGQTIRVSPTLQGLAPGLGATVSPEMVEVILAGPLADLSALQAGDVQVLLDLLDLGPGTYKISPQVVKPDSLEVQSIVPDQLEVVITAL